ncbi:DUF3426 domain-containing protein [Methylococcus geothermalis]|uniref:DUF3426 domain-containing protein n=1 Tax=Methylococcus geothermalis TaxID=2681310 RepID=A0A858Q9Z2_9GAMM|nr:DUF3426 domain-containing protein [Methylococcus geothermalis]QJD30752.1 DUF3426 domain-containing protein [Methylococcus geothermalis]
MFTRCPSCGTAYGISVRQLREGRGVMLCDHCGRVFNALPGLEESVPDSFSQPPKGVSGRWFGGGRRGYDEPARPGLFLRLVWSVGSIVLTIVLLGQVAYFGSMRFAQDEAMRPWLVMLCDAVGCQVPPYSDVESIQIVERTLRPVPATGGYEFRLVMANQSTAAQVFPSIVLRVVDRQGKPAAGRVFSPAEYLPKGSGLSMMPVGKSLEVRLDLAKPDRDISGFTFELI